MRLLLVLIKLKKEGRSGQATQQAGKRLLFEAILLWGQPDKAKGLKAESDTSPLYGFGEKKLECKLTITLPIQKLPWMLMLKLSCHERNKPANASRNYGMKVVGVG